MKCSDGKQTICSQSVDVGERLGDGMVSQTRQLDQTEYRNAMRERIGNPEKRDDDEQCIEKIVRRMPLSAGGSRVPRPLRQKMRRSRTATKTKPRKKCNDQ